MRVLLFLSTIFFLCMSCAGNSQRDKGSGLDRVSEFDEYWYASLAEITGYSLSQSRYGEIHAGDATLIFVTEPFNTKTQVKSDNGVGKNTSSVLKLNQTRKFYTGIYPYSTMTSSFTPVENIGAGQTEKVTNSVQEWCGQVYMQMNKKGNQYDIRSYSYFESEGDVRLQTRTALLEDEVFSLIRLNPEALPMGKVDVFPSTVYLRFMHKPIQNYAAVASKRELTWEGERVTGYEIDYTELGRKFTIYYTPSFPYTIVGWEEEYPSLRGPVLTTRAVRKETVRMDYWNKNAVADSVLQVHK